MSHAECNARYYAENREECKARSRAYRAEHREEINARQRVYDATHREERRARQLEKQRVFTEWLQILTSTYTCDICGGPPDSWHHVDPSTKRKSVSQMYAHSLDNIEAELEKCIPLCRSCHTNLHNAERVA